MTGPRVLLTVGANVSQGLPDGPRRDYAQLATLVDADILDLRALEVSLPARIIRRTLGAAPAQAWMAFRRRGRYDVILTDGEHVGIPLSLLLRVSRARVKHITIGHRLSAPKKRPFFRLLGAAARLDRIALHSRHQYDLAIERLGIDSRRLALIPYHVDTSFFRPSAAPEEHLIVSAGLEFRDYDTLFQAVAGLSAEVVVAASSQWSRHRLAASAPPPNVRISSFDYGALRQLYARAALVVVPLADADNQAGITTILEGMAMGKAVIVTQSAGQTDVIEDRRDGLRSVMRPRGTTLLRTIAAAAQVPVEATGFYVAPGDAGDLRRAIEYLLAHPDDRARLGTAGRRTAVRLFTVEQFAERMQSLIRECVSATPEGVPFRRAHSR